MRRKERSGPGIGNCDDAVMGPASGVEVAVEESETADLAESPALADKQPREKSETITKTDRQEGHFMAGSPLESEGPHATRSNFAERQGFREPSYALFLGLGFLASDSNAAQNTPSSRIIQGISYFFAGFLFTVTKMEEMAVGTEAEYSNCV
jgi:hypothetical protein